MKFLLRLFGTTYRKIESLLRPLLYQREKQVVLKRYPHLQAVMEAFERHYIRSEYGAHDRSLMERIQRKLTEDSAYVYGSTPWRSFLAVADSLQIKPEDVFIELGCGTGHLCFLINQVYGIRSIGIEMMANFIQTAETIKKELSESDPKPDFSQLKFYNLSFFQADLSQGSIFYMAGTCFPEEYRQRLLQKVADQAPDQSILITLTHEIDHPAYCLSHRVEGTYSWGRDKALIYRLQKNKH